MQRNPLVPQFAAALFFSWCLSGGNSAAELNLRHARSSSLTGERRDIPEVIAALRRAIGLQVTLRGTVAQKFTGVYSGSVHYVLTRLLTGENYVLRTTSSGIASSCWVRARRTMKGGPVCSLYSGRRSYVAPPCKFSSGESSFSCFAAISLCRSVQKVRRLGVTSDPSHLVARE